MIFHVDQTAFSGEIHMDNFEKIKSYNKDYFIHYNSNTLSKIINDEYEVNDFIIIDRNVFNLDKNCLSNIDSKFFFIFDAIEENKNINSTIKIIDSLFDINFNKKNKLLIIGGGITQDVGGLVAGIYKRGLKWTLIPTTLLAMADSCIGGKVGVNHKSKNMLALFCAPDKVIISDFFIQSLSKEDIISGIGEIFKLSLIGGNISYQFFKENFCANKINYINLMKMSTSVKKLIIEKDELENNERKVLNYGHTFGHAIESATNYFIPHGIAVMFGMYIINNLFYGNKYENLNNFIINNIPDKFKKINISYDTLIYSLLNDKKNNGDSICFVLLEELGKSKFVFKKLIEIEIELKNILQDIFLII